MSYVANRTLFLRVGGAGLCRPTKSWDQVLESNFFEHPVRAGVRWRCPVLGEGVKQDGHSPGPSVGGVDSFLCEETEAQRG